MLGVRNNGKVYVVPPIELPEGWEFKAYVIHRDILLGFVLKRR
jgi:hypothetical protein